MAYECPYTRGIIPDGDVLDVAVEGVRRDRRHRRQDPEEDREPGHQRQDVVRFGLLPEELLELCEFLRVLGGEVLGLGEVVRQVVELPGVLVRVVGAGGESRNRRWRCVPGDAVELAGGPPAVLVDRPVAVDLEVLHGVPLGRARIVEAVQEARPLHRLLGDPINHLGLWDPGRFEDRRPDVDAVGELGTQRAGVPDPLRPGDDHAVAGAAQVRGDLFAPLEGSVARPRPGARVVRGDASVPHASSPPYPSISESCCSGVSVIPFCIVSSLTSRDGALHARAVVTEDVEHECVVALVHFLDGIQQPSDVPVGVLLVARVDLHLARVESLLAVRE